MFISIIIIYLSLFFLNQKQNYLILKYEYFIIIGKKKEMNCLSFLKK